MKPSKKTHGYAIVFPKQGYALLSLCKYSANLEPYLFFPRFRLRYKALKIKSSSPGSSIVKMIQFELRIHISQRKFAETFRTVEIHLRKSSREIFRAKKFCSEISLTIFSLEIELKIRENGERIAELKSKKDV